MRRWNLVIDIEKCEGCHNCFLACKDEHVGNDWKGYALGQPKHGSQWIKILRKERGRFPIIDVAYLPVLCMHCDDAPCLRAAKNRAAYKRDDGIVLIDPGKAKGQRDIAKACPYGASEWNDEKEVSQKCTLCAHLLDSGWKEPRCVQACPTGALRSYYLEEVEMKEMAAAEHLEVLHPEYGTSPRVYYRNLFRFFRCFVAGSVAFEREGRFECAEGAQVMLLKEGQKIGEVLTDAFGDFKFDHLEENSGGYCLEIFFEGFEKELIQVDLKTSLTVGAILL
jgi:Fe-S-cluster-containing dehydrogenase component